MRLAITGNLCSGKSYLAKILVKKYNLELFSFAGKIKEIANDLFDSKFKDRLLLQNIADKMKEIDPDVWIKYVIKSIEDKDNIIIDDLRFPNELKYLKENGFIIIRLNVDEETRIQRIKNTYPDKYSEHIKGMNHNSEKNIANLKVDIDIDFIPNDYNLNSLSLIEKYLKDNM